MGICLPYRLIWEVIQVQEGIAHVLREDRLRTNDETLAAHVYLNVFFSHDVQKNNC